MPFIAKNRPYRWLAQYYDQFFKAHRASHRKARGIILKPIFPRVKSVCDLACGTGTTAIEFARKGIKTFAVDSSGTMCRVVRQKSRANGLSIRVFQADMRHFELPETVDLTLCEFDALNHLAKKEDLSETLCSVANALSAGGYFYFDVNRKRAFQVIWPDTTFVQRPGVAMVMQSGYASHVNRGWADITWFIKSERSWRRHREHFEEVCWTDDEMRRACRDSGFITVRKEDASLLIPGEKSFLPGCRTFYLLKKR
jgi:SAM-dependent methyltransferase